MSWDAENGVWVGDKAIGTELKQLPNPLFLFGYGSLIWRSGELLAGMTTYHCRCESWSRVFAQRSMDHRGRPIFPGLVLNLVSDKYLEDSNVRTKDETAANPSSCIGVVYHVPDSQADAIVAELDFRERGG
jgi:cation transport protein ChaC